MVQYQSHTDALRPERAPFPRRNATGEDAESRQAPEDRVERERQWPAAQRRQVAHHAGARWAPLFHYLAERRPLLE